MTTFITSLNLILTDSAWPHDHYEEAHDAGEKDEKEYYVCANKFVVRAWKTRWLQVMILTLSENIVCYIMVAFYLGVHRESRIPYYDGIVIVAAMFTAIFVRWLLIFHWVLPVHFHDFSSSDNRDQIINRVREKKLKKSEKKSRAVELGSPKRKNLYIQDLSDERV